MDDWDPPRLFPWGTFTPGEFDRYVRRLELDARQERGETGPWSIAFASEGVRILSEEMLKCIQVYRATALVKSRPIARAPNEINTDLGQEVRAIAYLLVAYCSKRRKPVPAVLLQVLFEALGLVSDAAPSDVKARLGLPGVTKMEAFKRAAELDGEADANGQSLGLKQFEDAGIAKRATVRRWREMDGYKRLRRGNALRHGLIDEASQAMRRSMQELLKAEGLVGEAAQNEAVAIDG